MPAVPRILHQIVGPKTNKVIDHCLSSWQMLRDYGFEYRTWNDQRLTEFISKEYPFALEAFLHARNHAEAADIARYLLVHHTGGYYMDWDVQLLSRPKFLQLIKKTSKGFLIQDPSNLTIAAEAFSAGKNETYLLDLVYSIVHLYEGNKRDMMTTPEYSGPFRMRDVLQQGSTTKQRILPVDEVFAYNYAEIREMPEKVITQPLVHYWLHTWFLDVKI